MSRVIETVLPDQLVMILRNKKKRWISLPQMLLFLLLLSITIVYAPKMWGALFRNTGSVFWTRSMVQSPGLNFPVLEPVMDLHLGQSAPIQSAIILYERSLRWNPLDIRSRYNLGSVLLITGQYSDAIENLSTAMDLGATDPLAYLRLGSALWNSGDDTNAVAAFQRANASDFLISRGDQYSGAKLTLAETYYQVALLTGEQTRGFSGLGRVRLAEGKWGEARDYFLKALELDQNNAEAEIGLGNVFLYGLGDPHTARPHLKHAVDLQPGLWVYLLMGDSYRSDGDYAEATRWYGRAAVADPNSEQPLIFQGWNLQAQGKLDQAIEMFRAAQIKNSAAAQPDAALAALYALQGKWPQAIDYYQSAIQKEPWNAWHHIWLGDVYLAAEQVAEATAEYRRALELSPENTIAQQRVQSR